MKKSRLTEKNMADRRFKRTERAIFIAYYKMCDYPIAKRIARKAKISRATFYRHHQTASSIPRDHEEYLFKTYTTQMKKYLKKPSNLQTIFLRFLVFLSSNKEVIKLLLCDGRKETIKKMINHLKPVIICSWRFAGNLDNAYNVYENEVLGVIEFWGQKDFAVTKLSKILSEILYLTKTASERLIPLIEPEELK